MRFFLSVFLFSLLILILTPAASLAADRKITAQTVVLKWGQMPRRFEIDGQELPDDTVSSDFIISGTAASWGSASTHVFSCGVKEIEATDSGWALIPELFPDKFFYVREMTVRCEKHPELGFQLSDIAEILTETADRFTNYESEDHRLTARLFSPEAEGAYPVIIVFHGYGDTENLLTYRTAVAWAEEARQKNRPCTVVAPSIPDSVYTSAFIRRIIFENIMTLVDRLISEGRADPSRIYAMGNSFGGMSAFEIAEEYPDRIAAVLALCPALNYSPDGTRRLSELTRTPVFIAQAENDETIPVSVGTGAAEALRAAGNRNVEIRIYSDEEMNAAGAVHGSNNTYSFHHVELAVMEDSAYADWLFSQQLP